jgi:hypothetical protein
VSASRTWSKRVVVGGSLQVSFVPIRPVWNLAVWTVAARKRFLQVSVDRTGFFSHVSAVSLQLERKTHDAYTGRAPLLTITTVNVSLHEQQVQLANIDVFEQQH